MPAWFTLVALRRTATVFALLVCAACGGSSASSEAEKPVAQLEFEGTPCAGQVSTGVVSLTTADGLPVLGAGVQLEANMNHAGMQPVFAEAEELGLGRYAFSVDLTMGGDWFVLVDVKTQAGEEYELQVDLPGVLSEPRGHDE